MSCPISSEYLFPRNAGPETGKLCQFLDLEVFLRIIPIEEEEKVI